MVSICTNDVGVEDLRYTNPLIQDVGKSALEPAHGLFVRWRATQYASSVLCRVQQRLESKVLRQAQKACLLAQGTGICSDVQISKHGQALEAEVLAMTAVLKLQDLIPDTPAKSLIGVLAKLEMIVGADREIGDPTDFPWPHLASVLDDLRAIAGELPVEKPDRRVTRALVSRYMDAAKKNMADQVANSGQSRDSQSSHDMTRLHHHHFS